MWLLSLRGELGLAPKAREGARCVLDAGCGNGVWSVDFGMVSVLCPKHEATVTNFDRPQPTYIRKPRLVKFRFRHQGPTHTSQVIGVDLSPIQPSL